VTGAFRKKDLMRCNGVGSSELKKLDIVAEVGGDT